MRASESLSAICPEPRAAEELIGYIIPRMDRGDNLEEMGTQLPTIDLGTDFEAVQLVAGSYHTCALSRQGAVKCWGWWEYLGLSENLGSYSYVGTGPGEMGDALPALDLGGNLPFAQLSAGYLHTCAVAWPWR